MHGNISFITAFFAGLLSFVSPCVLPLIPAYISYITGLSLEELKNQDTLSRKAKLKVFLSSIWFVIGFSAVFVILGATATAIGSFFLAQLNLIMKIAGVIIIIFGLHTAGWLKIKWLYYEKRIQMNTSNITSYLSIFLMGAAFAFGWSPCIGPILAAILVYASSQDTILKGILLLFSYSLGLGIPFILTALAVNKFFSAFAKIKKYFRTIEILSGLLLILVGILIFVGSLGAVSAYFTKWFPFLTKLG